MAHKSKNLGPLCLFEVFMYVLGHTYVVGPLARGFASLCHLTVNEYRVLHILCIFKYLIFSSLGSFDIIMTMYCFLLIIFFPFSHSTIWISNIKYNIKASIIWIFSSSLFAKYFSFLWLIDNDMATFTIWIREHFLS